MTVFMRAKAIGNEDVVSYQADDGNLIDGCAVRIVGNYSCFAL
jgi:hypothetical protein